MAWETRGGRQYLYRSYRDESGRVRRQYLGRGSAAVAAAARAKSAGEQDAHDGRQVQALMMRAEPRQQQIAELDTGLRQLTEAVLLSRGFHKHAGIWRKTRETRKTNQYSTCT